MQAVVVPQVAPVPKSRFRWLWLLPLAAVVGVAGYAVASNLLTPAYFSGGRVNTGFSETDGGHINGIISGIVGMILAFLTAKYGTVLGDFGKVLGSLGVAHALTESQQKDEYERIKFLTPTYVPPVPPVTP